MAHSFPKPKPLSLKGPIAKLKSFVIPNTTIKGETLDIIDQLLIGLLNHIAHNTGILLDASEGKKIIRSALVMNVTEMIIGLSLDGKIKNLNTFIFDYIRLGKLTSFPSTNTVRYFQGKIPPVLVAEEGNTKIVYSYHIRKKESSLGHTLALILEAMCTRIFEVSSSKTLSEGRSRITPRDLYLAIQEDFFLEKIFRRFMMQGGAK